MSIGERIKARRKQLGINADTLAERVGISRSTLFRWEKGDIDKKDGVILNRIASALHTTSEYLFGLIDDPDAQASSHTEEGKTVTIYNDEVRFFATGMDRVPENMRNQAIAILRAFFKGNEQYFERNDDNDAST